MNDVKNWSLKLAVLLVTVLGTAGGWEMYQGTVARGRADVEAVQDRLQEP